MQENAPDCTADIVIFSQTAKSTGTVNLKILPKEKARVNAISACAACWGLALVTLPVPILHFIAPPLLILMGPISALIIYKLFAGAVDVLGGQGTCPDCMISVSIEPRSERWPVDILCSGCGARLFATKKDLI